MSNKCTMYITIYKSIDGLLKNHAFNDITDLRHRDVHFKLYPATKQVIHYRKQATYPSEVISISIFILIYDLFKKK